MFDNQPGGGAGSPPSNLPIEPEDMFAGVEKDTASAPVLPNALNAGVLKKKVDLPSPAMPVGSSPTPSPGIPTSPIATAIPPTAATPVPVQPTPTGVSSVAPPPVYAMKEPILGKIILVLVLGVMLGGLGFGGWWVYNYMQNGSGQSNQTKENTAATSLPAEMTGPTINGDPTTPTPIANSEAANNPATSSNGSDVPVQMNNDKILFGEPIDSDKDGLDDIREKELSTDPNKADTDGDALTDGDEVLIWHTNPLNPDTDGDTYLDGEEVKHGYNPNGPGKLFSAPSGASTTTNTTNTVNN